MKVTEMAVADRIKDGDVLMIVQDGENKQIPASAFQSEGSTAENAKKLNGYTDEDFVKKNEPASDTVKVNGIPAEDMATKAYVDSKTSAMANDWNWCCPQLWFDREKLPNNDDAVHFAYCDGRTLNKNQYSELFEIIGYNYSQVKSGDLFQIPDMMGRFPLGAYTKGKFPRNTYNLPYGVYKGEDFTADGQFIFPTAVGKTGGDPTTTQEHASQIASHSHEYDKTVIASGGEAKSEAFHRVNPNYSIGTTKTEGDNVPTDAIYPPNDFGNPHNTGMLSMPPYLTFAWVMQIKKFD